MNKLHIQIDYCLEFKSAFHFGTGLRNGLIHRAIAKDKDDFLYVPGSTLKGVVRDKCEQILGLFELSAHEPHTEISRLYEAHPQPTLISRIFGSRFQPGTVYFDDANLVDAQKAWFESPSSNKDTKDEKRSEYRARQIEQRTQVSLSRLTRTAQPGALYHSEYGMHGLTFHGEIKGVLKGTPLLDVSGNFPLLVLAAGLLSIDRIGGNKSTGAGEVDCSILENQLKVNGEDIQIDDLLEELPYLDKEFYTELREEAFS